MRHVLIGGMPDYPPRHVARLVVLGFALIALAVGTATAAPPEVLEPSVDERVAAGFDFATQELGDPWDFDRIEDVFTPESILLADESVSEGVYRMRTLQQGAPGLSDAHFWLIVPGLINSQRLVSHDRNPATGRTVFTREKFPIDPQTYRHITARVRMTSATAQPLSDNQPFLVYWYEDETSIGDARFGFSEFVSVPPNQWVIVELDLATDVHPDSQESWTGLPGIEGLRIDPTNRADVVVEIDWIRLTSDPEPEHRFTVQWNGNGAASYQIAARNADLPLASKLVLADTAATSAEVSLARLPPGRYRIEVNGNGETGISDGLLLVNDVPLANLTRPDIRGEQALAYGAAEASNPWGPIDPDDFLEFLDFETVSYDNPPGSLYARPLSGNNRILWQTPEVVDTAYYRMLCYVMEVHGPRDIGTGSVARFFWGNNRATLTTSAPIIVQEGLNEYCLGDLTGLRIEPESPPETQNPWAGPSDFIRFDPHEFPRTGGCDSAPTPEACRDIRIDSFRLAPFHRANPEFTFQWTDSDADDNAQLEIWLDDDRIPGNTPASTEHLVSVASENAGSDSLLWEPPEEIGTGAWFVYIRADDGLNTTTRYASGPLVVGAPPVAAVRILQPDGVDDDVEAGNEYGLRVRNDEFDMSPGEFDPGTTLNISGATFAAGVFSGTATSNDPQFTLMSTAAGDPSITASIYRYLTMKIRVSDAGQAHFVQVLFSADPEHPPASTGFTSGIPVFEDEWAFITFDLVADTDASSPIAWNDIPNVRAIRIDPTNRNGGRFEIDWITISSAPDAGTEYTIRWENENTGLSTFDLSLVDALGHRIPVIGDLPAGTVEHTVNLGYLITGPYHVEIDAVPGPVAFSPGPIELGPAGGTDASLFKDGFE